MKTLAELRASKKVSLPERTYPLCLSQSLVAEAQSLEEERQSLAEAKPTDDGKGKPPTRVGEKADPRIAEIEARFEALMEEMREHTGELRLRGTTAGEWRRWADDNPARKDSKIDEDAAYGLCDASALLATLGQYAVAWNSDALAPGDWDFIESKAAPGDLKELCRLVVQMHEGAGIRAPKLPSTSGTEQTSETA